MKKSDLKSDFKNAAVCGIFCPSCAVYYATQENDTEKLTNLGKRFGLQLEDMYCDGCRSERKMKYCSECCFIKCADEKQVSFCGECAEYPCEELKKFQVQMPHRAELWKNQDAIKNQGWEKWYSDMREYYACTSCETINGAYDIKCRVCSQTPSNEFVKNNQETIISYLSKL